MNAAIIEESVTRFTHDPAPAQSAPAVTAHLTDGAADLHAGAFTWASDLPPALGGGNTAPSPTVYQAWLERCPIYLAISRRNVVGTRFQTQAAAEDAKARQQGRS